jgi:thioredoxin-related protein
MKPNSRMLSACLALAGISISCLHAREAESPFTTDLAAAKAKALAEHKDILVDFTGSDWCGWCLVLDREVFLTAEFKSEASKAFELVQLDFPHDKTKQSQETAARNKAWKAELKSNSFPDILLLDEKGKVFGRTSYREGGAKPFLSYVEALRQRRIRRDAAMTEAEKSAGIERARHLDQALSALNSDEVLLTYYRDVLDEILALDPRDEGGLQTKYKALFARRDCNREIDRLSQNPDGAAMLTQLKEYAARPGIPVESRQYAIYMAGALACERVLKDQAQALELVEQAIELAPHSQLAEQRLLDAKKRLERKGSNK